MASGKLTIAIIGAGNMGEALIKGVLDRKLVSRKGLFAADKKEKRRRYIRKRYKIRVFSDNRKACLNVDTVILAVKPQEAGTVLKEIGKEVGGEKLIISIMAGITTQYIEGICPGTRVMRVMPNMPALIGEGVSVLCTGKYTKREDLARAESIFKCVGEAIFLDESLMDTITALSGSGPAYLFYLAEALISTAIKRGLEKKVANKLIEQTFLGSALLLKKSPLSGAELIKRVTSKGGTTEAALKIFEKEGLEKTVEKAIESAIERSKRIAKWTIEQH